MHIPVAYHLVLNQNILLRKGVGEVLAMTTDEDHAVFMLPRWTLQQLCLPLGLRSQEVDPYDVAWVSPLCSFTLTLKPGLSADHL